MSNDYEACAALYAQTKRNFFAGLSQEAAKSLHAQILDIADEIRLSVNWFIPSVPVQASNVFAPIRENTQVFTALIKLERLFMVNLAMADLHNTFLNSLNMFLQTPTPNKDIVDDDFCKILGGGTKTNLDITTIPGMIGLICIMLFRQVWNEPGRREGGHE